MAKAMSPALPGSSDVFCCGAIPHPSISLEAMLFNRSPAEVFAQVNRPLLLMPAKVGKGLYVNVLPEQCCVVCCVMSVWCVVCSMV
jgi:hypothetical protein